MIAGRPSQCFLGLIGHGKDAGIVQSVKWNNYCTFRIGVSEILDVASSVAERWVFTEVHCGSWSRLQ